MVLEKQTTEGFTHVRIMRGNNKRLLRIARNRSAKEDREVSVSVVLNEILTRELPKEEKKLGITD